ncbi:MAG: PAS domain-containing sensor histidine kinase [Bacteroidales bacterium]|nr:PAS domain-containing sensor histidine kinase [Bacteroidales bacterium]
MKIQYKFLIVFLVTFAITIIPNIFLVRSDVLAWLPFSIWSFLSIARFILLIGLFMLVIHYWIIKPLKQIAFALSLNDPAPVEALSTRRDEIGKIGILLQRFFSQREALDQVMKEKSQALESVAVSETKARALLNAIPDLMFRISSAGIITDYHAPDPSELFLPPEKFLGKRIEEMMPTNVVSAYYQAILDLTGLAKSKIFEYTMHMPDGSERAYEAMVASTGIGDYLIIVRNITIRKEAELEISRMLSKQRELIQLKSQFISLVSHEFRTPLAAISSNIQLLSRYQQKWPAEKKAEVLKRIQEVIMKMINLLEEVTLISKDQSGAISLNPEEFKVNEFVEEVIESLQQSSELPVNLELKMDQTEEYICSDRELLRQILFHLLSNAGKFSPQEKPVRVSISMKNETIEMTIEDHGIGIPENDVEHLFQPFHRGSNSAEFPGTGLGMTIVKRCVDLLKGSIRVNSRENEGTTVEVRIPTSKVKTTDHE